MAFSKATSFAILTSIVAFVHAEITLSDFSGVWRSVFHSPTANVFTPQGPALLCRDALSPKCNEELTPLELTYTFNATTVATELRDRVGITTNEQSAAAHPGCADDGLYPFERVMSAPPSQITSYNSKEGRIYFVDPRRPDDHNCMLARYRTGENGAYIEVTLVELYKGSIPNVFALGVSYRCDLLPRPCSVKVDKQGELDIALQMSFNLTCIEGDCLNTAEAASPSASHNPNESVDDL